MFYTIYKTTNLINGKFYIGKHQTKNLDDGYMGSGKLLKRAIKKYGAENFVKEILEVYDTEELMNLAEKILVVCDPEISYNLCSGGHGGFGYLNKTGKAARLSRQDSLKGSKIGNEKLKVLYTKKDFVDKKNAKWKTTCITTGYKHDGFYGKKHTPETLEKISKANKGRVSKYKGIPRSEETKRKISETLKLKSLDP